MSHNTVFGGASRENEGGTVLIGGVSREIESGLVLANGVSREIEFGEDTFTVTITGSGVQTNATADTYVKINGVTYISAAVVEVPAGTTVSCIAKTPSSSATIGTITLNGYTVDAQMNASYNHIVQSNTKITLTYRVIYGTTTSRIDIVEE